MTITTVVPEPSALLDFTRQLCDKLPYHAARTMAGEYQQLLDASQSITSWGCFQVGGQVYFENQQVWPQARVKGQAPALPAELLPAFKAWQRPYLQLGQDMVRIRQVLGSLLTSATCWQDVRNMLPDRLLEDVKRLGCIAELVRTAPDLDESRTNPSPGTPWDKRLINLYGQVSHLIDLYLGYKLL